MLPLVLFNGVTRIFARPKAGVVAYLGLHAMAARKPMDGALDLTVGTRCAGSGIGVVGAVNLLHPSAFGIGLETCTTNDVGIL